MSYVNPVINTNNAAPVNLDRIIEYLRSELEQNISWLNKFFGRAYEFKEMSTDGKTQLRIPKVYQKEGEYYNVLVNDSFKKGYLFFAQKGNERYIIYDPHSGSTKESIISIIAWFNLKHINPDADYIFTTELKQELEYYINNSGVAAEIIEWCDERAEQVFNAWDTRALYGAYGGVKSEVLMYPWAGIRCDIKIQYMEDCYP